MEDKDFIVYDENGSGAVSVIVTENANYTVTTEEAYKNSIKCPPEPIGYMNHRYTKTNIPVYEKMSKFRIWVMKVLFDMVYVPCGHDI